VVLQALKAAGVTEVILAINYQPEVRYQPSGVARSPCEHMCWQVATVMLLGFLKTKITFSVSHI
jgi:hypothetical protein